MTKVRYWKLDRFCLMICKMLLNKFDCLICIEGNRGLGKSTLAFHILTKVNYYFRKIYSETKDETMKEWYRFNPLKQLKDPRHNKCVIYTQKDVLNFYDKWHSSAISDEMINVAFNREFYSDDQKNLVKLLNMNRDHGNFLIACIPQFQTMDNQIKNLCKIRITVARRGLAVIQTPNRTIYNRDRWDSLNNERIEREWLRRGSGLPQYSKLNTFRGMVRFKALSQKQQWIYDQIKNKERNVIKGSLGVTEQKEEIKPKTPTEIALEMLLNGGVKNMQIIEGIAVAHNENPQTLKNAIKRKLISLKMNPQISSHFYDKKAQKQAEKEEIFEIA